MSLPAASAPVAVLVLAWDETIPAVRALVAATELPTPAVDSVVVLVPAGPANEEPTQEEFLPLPESKPPAALPAADVAASPAPVSTESASPILASAAPLPAAASAAAAVAPAAPASAGKQLLPAPPIPLPPPGVANPGIPMAATPGWSAVRVLRLSDYSLAALAHYAQQALPAPVWAGATSAPAAPYLGSTPPNVAPIPVSLGPAAAVADFALAFAPALSAPLPMAGPQGPSPSAATTTAQPDYAPTELPAAPAAEMDDAPPAPVASAEALFIELNEEAANELDSAFSADIAPVQAGWPAALAALQIPAAVPAGPATEIASTAIGAPLVEFALNIAEATGAAGAARPSALLPATQTFDAPNLNFQVIQYARFAVPLALADEPFAVIYAPAWPTWLAAQELRHRTGCPLVLHVATLAAAENEPLDLAAGWPAEIQRQALHRADLILTETPALAHRLRRELNLPAHRVRPVPAADAAAVAQALSTAQVQPPPFAAA